MICLDTIAMSVVDRLAALDHKLLLLSLAAWQWRLRRLATDLQKTFGGPFQGFPEGS